MLHFHTDTRATQKNALITSRTKFLVFVVALPGCDAVCQQQTLRVSKQNARNTIVNVDVKSKLVS